MQIRRLGMHLISIVLVIIVICITVIVIPDYKEEYQKRTLLEIFQENDINNKLRSFLNYAKNRMIVKTQFIY